MAEASTSSSSAPDVELGYAILSSHAGHGYASEAAALMLDPAHSQLESMRVTASTFPAIHASRRALTKIGMALDEIVRPSDRGADICLYASARG